jgi:CTD small phosphatase-like protein 2
MNKVILIDNCASNFELQPDNGIEIKSWYNETSDIELKRLQPLLESVIKQKIPDVRKLIQSGYFMSK